MFDSGARVGVIKSSSDRIKTGSIGYVCTGNHSTSYSPACDFTVDVIFINFTRFGYEKRARYERKKVVSVLPILDCAERHFDKQLEEMIKAADFNKTKWHEMCNTMGVDHNTPILLMAPVATSNINIMQQDKDFQAWANAVISQGGFGKTVRTLRSNINGPHPNAAKNFTINYDMLSYLSDMTGDRHYRQDKIADIIKRKETKNRKELIDLIQICRTLEKLFNRTNVCSNVEYLIKEKGHNDNFHAYAEEFSATCFIDPTHEKKVVRLKEAIAAGTPITNRVRKIVNNISTTRDELIKRMSTLI